MIWHRCRAHGLTPSGDPNIVIRQNHTESRLLFDVVVGIGLSRGE